MWCAHQCRYRNDHHYHYYYHNTSIQNLLFDKEGGDVSVSGKTSLTTYVPPLLHHLSAYVHLACRHAWLVLSPQGGPASLLLDNSGFTALPFLSQIMICVSIHVSHTCTQKQKHRLTVISHACILTHPLRPSMRIYTHMHALTYTGTQTYKHTHTHTLTCSYTKIQAHTHTHKVHMQYVAHTECQGMTITFFPTCPVGQVDEFSTCPSGKTSCPCQILKINHFD